MGCRNHARYTLAKSVAKYDHWAAARCLNPCGGIICEIAQGQLFHSTGATTDAARLQSRYAISGSNNGAREVLKILGSAPRRGNH
jgi:hypothetical protein